MTFSKSLIRRLCCVCLILGREGTGKVSAGMEMGLRLEITGNVIGNGNYLMGAGGDVFPITSGGPPAVVMYWRVVEAMIDNVYVMSLDVDLVYLTIDLGRRRRPVTCRRRGADVDRCARRT